MQKPDSIKYPGYFQDYISLVEENNVLEALHHQTLLLEEFLTSVTEDHSHSSYAPGKWTIKEILQHLIDSERIFTYRALCIARGEQQSLPGFEQDYLSAHP